MKRTIVVAILGTFALGAALVARPPAVLADDMEATVEKRIKSMKKMRRSLKKVKKIAAGKADWDADVMKSQPQTLVSELKDMLAMFPEGSNVDLTDARPEVWSDRAGFEAAGKTAIAAAENLASVGDADAAKGAYDDLRAACDGCHDKYLQD